METIQHSFRRYEKKFLLTPPQYARMLPVLREQMREDEYGTYSICNIYFDTDNFDLIRTSLDGPVYKEKFRLRSYGVPKKDGLMFAEIKKKYDGVVYKRRVDATPQAIRAFVSDGLPLPKDRQIQKEIRWFFHMYQPVPKVFIGYERLALAGIRDADLRITFDRNIRWRTDHLDLCDGDYGAPVLDENLVVMEVKTPVAIPLWLTELLSEEKIYTTGFSKYGTCYQRHLVSEAFQKGEYRYA